MGCDQGVVRSWPAGAGGLRYVRSCLAFRLWSFFRTWAFSAAWDADSIARRIPRRRKSFVRKARRTWRSAANRTKRGLRLLERPQQQKTEPRAEGRGPRAEGRGREGEQPRRGAGERAWGPKGPGDASRELRGRQPSQ